MCGILAIFGLKGTYHEVRAKAIQLSRRQKHRGPDDSSLVILEDGKGGWNIICHERLSIVDTSEHGRQPKYSPTKDFVYAVNGEIYNYPEVREQFSKVYNFEGHSDSETVGVLYQEYGKEKFCNYIEGMWGLVIYDIKNRSFIAARDHVGIIPLYCGVNKDGAKFISNELKCIHDQCVNAEIVKPGCYITEDWKQIQWYNPQWHDMDFIPQQQLALSDLKYQLEKSVKMQLMGDVPFGLLISGGVDSSLIAAITMKLVKSGEIDIKARGMTEVPSFCVGLEGSPDLEASQRVADFIGTKHYQLKFTVEEGLDAIPEVIYHTETFNQTTIRASTPMYIMARKIKAMGIKMVLTGEGADEIFGGYLYFHKAPNKEEFHRENIRKIKDLYKFDLLRANKSTLAWGLEVRPPFMQKEFIEFCMSFDPAQKMPKNNELNVEKYVLRKAFDDGTYLPKEILWRQKEQFSDGVGYKWLNGIKELCDNIVSEEMFQEREKRFPILPPMAKEMYLYRQIFESNYPEDHSILTVPYNKSIACSTEAALEWDESFKTNTDESGRAVLGVHIASEALKGVQK